jgi:hypothetical protein
MPTPYDPDHTHKIMYDCVQEWRRIGTVAGVFAKDNGEAEANARLLAAAPELLQCLESLIPWDAEPPQGWGRYEDAVGLIARIKGRNLWERSTDGLTRQ